MKLKKRLLSGALALIMVAGSFFINSGQTNAEDPVPWVPSQPDIDFAEDAPTDWAFTVNSVPLHNAILANYPAIDQVPNGNEDGYISISEAEAYIGSIDLQNKNITGTLEGIENFIRTKNIWLQTNRLTGIIPTNIGKLAALEKLYLSKNQITGSIPESIGLILGLKDISLENNQISGEIPVELFNSPVITTINLEYNKLTGTIPQGIAMGGNIKTVLLNHNQLTGELPKNYSNSLFSFAVADNLLSGEIPSNLYNLPGLAYANFETNKGFYGNPSIGFASSTSLKMLDIKKTGLIQAKPNIPGLIIFLYDDLAANLLTTSKDNLNGAIAQTDIDRASESAQYWADPEKTLWETNIAIAQAMLDAKTEVEALFKMGATTLADSVTEETIEGAQGLVDLIVPGVLQNELQAKLDLATKMLTAKMTTDALLTIAPNNTNLADGITQADITAAQNLVTALEDITAGDLKAELTAKIDTAQALLDTQILVAGLFTDYSKTALATGVTQETIGVAQVAVAALPDGTTKTNLQTDIDLVQQMIDAKTHVDALLTPDGANLESGVTKLTIDSAQAEVTALPDGSLKTELKAKIATAKALLNAVKLVDELLTDDKANLESGVTQGLIDQDKDIVNALPNGATRTVLLEDIGIAQRLLDAKNMVYDLFDNTGKIKDTVNQDTLNKAKEAVAGIPNGATKNELEALIAEAQRQLDARNYVALVSDKPFNSGTSTKTIGNVNTGDYSSNSIYLIVLLSAMIGLGFIIKRKIQKQA